LGVASNRFGSETVQGLVSKGLEAEHPRTVNWSRTTVNWIIDKLADERRSQTTLWQDIWKVFEFASSFIPGPIGWAARGVVAAVDFHANIAAAGDVRLRSSLGMSSEISDPHAGLLALGEAALQVVPDVPWSPGAKGAKPLTLGLEKLGQSTATK